MPKAKEMSDTQFTPEVGMGVTVGMYSDSLPATVVKVMPSFILIREDKAVITAGSEQDGSAKYTYEPDENGYTFKATLRKDGCYRSVKNPSWRLTFGYRHRYYDPHF